MRLTTTKEIKITNNTILNDIARSLEKLPFGTITIKIQDFKIVQVEITEKKRLDVMGFNDRDGGI